MRIDIPVWFLQVAGGILIFFLLFLVTKAVVKAFEKQIAEARVVLKELHESVDAEKGSSRVAQKSEHTDLREWCSDMFSALEDRQIGANNAINEMLAAQGKSLSLLNKQLTDLEAKNTLPSVATLPGGLGAIPEPVGEPHFEGLDDHVREIASAQKANKRRLPLIDDVPIAALSENERTLRSLLESAIDDAPEQTCIKCNNWDHKRGQNLLRREPAFAQAAQFLSPNKMGQKNIVDEAGNSRPDPNAKRFPDIFDTWELFGLCKEVGNLTNAVDTCPRFDSRGIV